MERRLHRFDNSGDHRQVFLRSCWMMTAAIRDALNTRKFKDADWVARLTTACVQRYFEALDRYESGRRNLPACWRLAFDNAARKRTSVLADLLLGVNAHLAHDYPFALSEVGVEVAHKDNHRFDHDTIGMLLDSISATIHNEIARNYDPELHTAIKLAPLIDELLMNHGVRLVRDIAWLDGEQLLWLHPYKMDWIVKRRIERRTENRAKKIVELGRLISTN